MAQNRITKSWLKNHWAYSWWKYLVLTAICIMGVNVLFTSTAYRAPEEKKIELYVACSYVDQQALKDEINDMFFERFPDQEELVVMNINLASGDVYTQMQFTTYLAAQQGDVLLLPRNQMLQLAAPGADSAFLELTSYIESGVIDLEKAGVEGVVLSDENGVEGIYAIPADSLYGLFDLGCNTADSYLCLTGFGGNEDTAAGVLNMLFELYQMEKPAGYDEAVSNAPVSAVF